MGIAATRNEQFTVCTIASANYLAFVRSACDSFLQHHPGSNFVVLLVDEPRDPIDVSEPKFEIIYAKDLPLKDFREIAFRFDVLELNTNLKPTFLKFLLQRGNNEKLVYVDPDVYFYDSLAVVFAQLDQSSIVLTPHCTTPIADEFKPSEQDFLRTGSFNLGFIGLRRTAETMQMLDWWETRCLNLGYNEIPSGLFVDQKWMNLAPCFFSSLNILQHPGCNMAYWNLHERVVSLDASNHWLVNGQYRLIFFHFSGIVLGSEQVISKYQNRYSFQQRPDLAELFSQYRQQIQRFSNNGSQGRLPYSYGFFSNGNPIPQLTRRIFGKQGEKFAGQDPFDANGPFYDWAQKHGLVGTGALPPQYTALTYNKQDWRLRLIHKSLLLMFRLLGVNRYTLLMKYLSFITVLGNQTELFSEEEKDESN